MSEDIRKMIDKIKNFNQFVNENINKPQSYFLRWTSDAGSDVKRNFSGHMQAWFDTEKEAMDDYNEKIADGKYVPYPPKKDVTTGMWNSEPEWGLSGYEFHDETSFNNAMKEINNIAWYHSENLQQELIVFRSSNYKLGDGFDGEDVFRDANIYWYIEPNMNYTDVMGIILNEQKILNETEKIGYDDLFIKLAWLKYYGEGTTEELKNIPKLESLLKSTPKPKIKPIPEDTRIEWAGVRLGEIISAEELPKIYERMGYFADDSTGKFNGNYKLMYIPVINKLTKYTLSDDYEDLEHFDRVNEYANVLRSGEELPPIIYTNGLFRDGAHRMAAHNDVGRKKILAFYSEK